VLKPGGVIGVCSPDWGGWRRRLLG
jgi:hypothetical protein